MKTLIWDSESDSLEQFLGLAGKYVDIDLFEDVEDLVTEVDEGDLLIFDLDFERKKLEKKLKALKKLKINFNLVFITSKMSSKEIAKHQKSKLGGDVYLKCPVDERVLISVLEPLLGEKLSVGLLDKQKQVLSEHEERLDVDESAMETSGMLDEVFRETLGEVPESSEALKEIEELEKKDGDDALHASEGVSEGTYPDLDLSAMEGEQSGDTEVQIDEEPEMAIDDKELDLESASELEVGDSDESGLDLSLDDDSGMELGDGTEELGLDLAGSDEQLVIEEDNGLELGEDSDDGLELSSDSDDSLELGNDDLSDALDLGQEMDESQDLSLSEDMDAGMDLDLGADELISAEDADLGIEADEAELSLSDDLGEDISSDVDLSSLELSDEEEAIEFGDGSQEVDLSEDAAAAELNFNDDIEELEDLSFGAQEPEQETEQEPEQTHNEFKVNTEPGFDMPEDELSLSDDDLFNQGSEDSLSADSLPDAPELNSSGTSNEMSDDALEKLAEIEKMMAFDENEPSSDIDIVNQLNSEEEDFDPTQESSDSSATQVFTYDAQMEPAEDNYLAEQTPSNSDFSLSGNKTIDEQKGILESHDNEFSRLGETIKHLRQDRQALLDKVAQLEDKISNDKSDFSTLQAELEEKRIEISLINKRRVKQLDELRYRVELADEKKSILEEKNKRLEQENEKLRKKTSVDLNKIKNRERELENKLELLKADTELQIRNRDFKILELKRKIDTLEFDMESIQVKEKKTVDNKYAMEERMERVINTLRRAIGELEEDEAPLRDIKNLKKSLDV
ncbi:MAG: hypothetical protein KC478_00185 [Bacteriovoracaceae bacterium]|nr:hypothetical protein [Bacteriovoracaceae bacterium]